MVKKSPPMSGFGLPFIASIRRCSYNMCASACKAIVRRRKKTAYQWKCLTCAIFDVQERLEREFCPSWVEFPDEVCSEQHVAPWPKHAVSRTETAGSQFPVARGRAIRRAHQPLGLDLCSGVVGEKFVMMRGQQGVVVAKSLDEMWGF